MPGRGAELLFMQGDDTDGLSEQQLAFQNLQKYRVLSNQLAKRETDCRTVVSFYINSFVCKAYAGIKVLMLWHRVSSIV